MNVSAVGWRAALLGALVLVALYAAIALLRLLRMNRRGAARAAWKQDPVQFGEQQFMRGVEDELHQLREQLTELRAEVERLKSSRNVSPQYGDAVMLAQQGMDAHSIAERCGIAVAEAELVRALSQQAGRAGEP